MIWIEKESIAKHFFYLVKTVFFATEILLLLLLLLLLFLQYKQIASHYRLNWKISKLAKDTK